MSRQDFEYAILFIGNPGAGKSTLLNCLANERLFKSGQSYGEGLTYQLDEHVHRGIKFMDTPGLADKKLREAAGKAISEALKRGGKYRIVFFVRVEAGRPVNEDITTLKLVLDAAPEIGNSYGVIIPKVTAGTAEGLRDGSNWSKVYAGIFNESKFIILLYYEINFVYQMKYQ